MKNVVFFFLLLFSSMAATAQNHLLGLKGGVTWAKITKIEAEYLGNEYLDYRRGWTLGVTYEYQFEKPFSVGLDLQYIPKGLKLEVDFTDITGAIVSRGYGKDTFGYLSAFFKGGVVSRGQVYGFANVGLAPSFLIRERYMNKNPYGDTVVVSTKAFNRMDVVGVLEVGVGSNYDDMLQVFVSFDVQYGLLKLRGLHFTNETKSRHLNFTLSMGMKFILPRKNDG